MSLICQVLIREEITTRSVKLDLKKTQRDPGRSGRIILRLKACYLTYFRSSEKCPECLPLANLLSLNALDPPFGTVRLFQSFPLIIRAM